MSVAQATEALRASRELLERARAARAQAHLAFAEAAADAEVAAARELDEADRVVQVEKLRVEKREAALEAAKAAEREAAQARRAARVTELRAQRSAFVSGLGRALPLALKARAAFAAAVHELAGILAAENERAAELRGLGEVEPATDIDVVRLALGQLIEREAPREPTSLEQVPTKVLDLAIGLASAPTPAAFEESLRQIRNEFAAASGPTLADFCSPQPLILTGANLATDLNARGAAALLREIEETPCP